MRRFLSSTGVRCRHRLLSTAAARVVVRAGPSTSSSSDSSSSQRRLPPTLHVYGGNDSERRALEARLARVLAKSPMLRQESLGVVILGDTFAAPEEDGVGDGGGRAPTPTPTTAAGAAATNNSGGGRSSSAPLAQAFLDFPLVSGSLLTVFNVSEEDRLRLVAMQGEDVLDAWAKDTLRRHLASMGGIIEARHPLVLEPCLLDLGSETAALEDDEELAWALSKKQQLVAEAVPGSFIPPRYLQHYEGADPQPQRMVCLVFPRREVKSTEWLHRIQRAVVDFSRKHMVPTQTHYLSLEKATSPDPAAREAEARRFCEMAKRLPPQTLILGEEAALDVLVEWTARLNYNSSRRERQQQEAAANGGGGNDQQQQQQQQQPQQPPAPHHRNGCSSSCGLNHQVTTYNLALTNYLFQSPSDVMAGPRLLASLSARDTILVAHHNPNVLSTAKAKQQAELRGERIVSVLDRLFEERAKGNPALKPRIEAGALKDHVGDLSGYTLLVLHSGAHAVDDEAVTEVLTAASDAGVPVMTPGLLRAWFRDPRAVAAALRPWPPSFSFAGAAAGGAMGAAGVGTVGGGGGQGGEVWDFGYRKKSYDCSDCSSWACGDCTKEQQRYARRLGGQHRGEIGQEWRDLF